MAGAHPAHQRQKIARTPPPPRVVSPSLKERLIALADKYEAADFSMGDPSCVLGRYQDVHDTECAAFLMAVLSFGRRDQFLPRALQLLDMGGDHPAQWIATGQWQADFAPDSTVEKFYRFYSYDDIKDVLRTLQGILQEYGSLGEAVRERGGFGTPIATQSSLNHQPVVGCFLSRSDRKCIETTPDPALVISDLFPHCRAVSHGAASAHKRTRMFLRWMVRRGSPVDLGLWTWLNSADLIIPLDTHVLQTAISLGLLDATARADGKTATELTSVLAQVWPDDPCRGDFALFGLGVESTP